MPYADNKGVKIYYEAKGSGPAVIMHSGLTGSHKDFTEFGYTEQLVDNYTVIQMDARGHGSSDKPHNPEDYKLHKMVADVTTILDAHEISKGNFFGYSIGGKTGLGILRYAPHRFNSLIIGGWGAVETDSPDEIKRNQTQIKHYRAILEQGVDALVDMFIEYGMSPEGARYRALTNDWEAIFALKSTVEHIGWDTLLPSVKVPCLFYAGDEDSFHNKARKTATQIPSAEFISLPGLDHALAFRNSEAVIPHLKKFLRKHNR